MDTDMDMGTDPGQGTDAAGTGTTPGTRESQGQGEHGKPLLQVQGLHTHFSTPDGIVKAVDGVDLTVHAGRTLCVVGESGCGKSITARSILQLIDPPGQIVDGQIHWRTNGDAPVDLTAVDPDGPEIRRVRGGEIGMVFQEPMASL
ncbi:ATP-binding cassette domain-containing protein, partial [Phytoactinopolyspora endophytica]|uniref:ATP-binding cassette domain-containing protein n=1 Tax=Phytoactinopolyspora endophytica TaxID=1642495 RepID=UPI00197C4B05